MYFISYYHFLKPFLFNPFSFSGAWAPFVIGTKAKRARYTGLGLTGGGAEPRDSRARAPAARGRVGGGPSRAGARGCSQANATTWVREERGQWHPRP